MIPGLLAWWVALAPNLTVPTPVEHPEHLASFAQALAEVGQRRVRITHFGDSHVAGDLYTHAAREALQARFGDGGRGFVPPGRLWASQRLQGVALETEGRWRGDGLSGGLPDGGEGLAGCALAGAPPALSVHLRPSGATPTAVDIHSLRQPMGGCFELRLDGQTHVSVPGHGHRIAAQFHRVSLPKGVRALSLHPSVGEVRLLGVDLQRPTGLVYDAVGINGAVATRLLQAHDEVFSAGLARLAPDLVILAYGTNEVYSEAELDAERYALGLDRVLARIRAAAPQAACLLQGPPDFQRKGRPVPGLATVLSLQRERALAHGCAFWDAQAAMGGAGSVGRWRKARLAQADRVHLTRDGYVALGQALAEALIAAASGR